MVQNFAVYHLSTNLPVLVFEAPLPVGQESTLEEGVFYPVPLSVEPPVNLENSQQQLSIVTGNTQRRPPTPSTVVSIKDIYFERIKISENPAKYELQKHEVVPSSGTEDATQVSGGQSSLPYILREWKLTTKRRSNNSTEDRFYRHPSSSRLLRSMVEVTNFVNKTFESQDTESLGNQRPGELPVPSTVELPETSYSNKKKRKRAAAPGVSNREHANRERACGVEEFLAGSFDNLLTMSVSTPIKEATLTKEFVEKFLAEAYQKLLESEEIVVRAASFNNSTNTTDEVISEKEVLVGNDVFPPNEQDKDCPDVVRDLGVNHHGMVAPNERDIQGGGSSEPKEKDTEEASIFADILTQSIVPDI